MLKSITVVFPLFFAFLALSQDVEIVLDPNEARLPLGFIDFKPAPGETRPLPVDPGRVIIDDLTFSDRVKIIEALKDDNASRNYFMMNEAYAFISGHYSIQGNQINVMCFLKDAETAELIFGKQYTAKRPQLRTIAHKFSDELVYQLFGERGIAQTQIIFVSKQSGNKEVYTMDYDGANIRRVTHNSAMNLLPCWLRDNASILYTSYKSGRPQLTIKNLPNGNEEIFLYSKYLNTGSDYNAIDGEIVYTSSVKGNTEIFRISESGKRPVRLTFSSSLEASPSWSPNGYEIVFTSGRSGRPMLYIMDRDGSNVRRLTYEGRYNTSPSWSPKGDKIAFCSMTAGGRMDIFIITPTGKNLRRLTYDSGSNESPSWSPDGRAIVFCSDRLGRKELYCMRDNGSKQQPLTAFGQNSSPDWSYFK